MRPNNELVAVNVLSSGTSTSNVMWSQCWIRASFQVTCGSGTMTGTFTVQGSNDIAQGVPPNQFTPTNWNTIGSGATQAVITCSFTASVTTPACALIPFFDTCYQYHRVQFVPASGAQGWYNIRVETRNL